jgi:carotenoid cleavage dioxygenase
LWKGFADPLELKNVTARLLKGENPFKNTANTALVWHHGKLLALWELGFPHELSLPELETIGGYSFGGALRHAMTAHPKIDGQTGEMMAIGYSPLPPFLQYTVFDQMGRIAHTTPIPVHHPVFMHDFAITEHHTVLLETPAVFDPYSTQRGGEFVRYRPELGARIGILARHSPGDQIRWFEIETCFVYHILNAFEDEQKIHLYACRMPQYPKAFGLTTSVTADDFLEIYGESKPVMYRWTVDLQANTVKEEPLDDRLAEYPRVADRCTGLPTKYGYAIGSDPNSTDLLQYDLQTGHLRRHEFGKGQIAGETVFAPRPGGTAEDDGWLVTYVFDRATGKSECVLLDARDVTQPPVARVALPQRVPYGFHALWVDDLAPVMK